MKIYRKAYARLKQWKTSENRKPLLLRGARQVGKTTLVREFAEEFTNYIELNLERAADRKLFEIDDVKTIINAACLQKGVIWTNKPTLLFIDEIQESPKAIQQLRYFREDIPELYVIAAGSLLEFALHEIPSFPVGRIDYLYLHPLNYAEYLGALGNQMAQDLLQTIPIPDYAHETLLKLFNEYAIVGGMPEIVTTYLRDKKITQLTALYGTLWQAYKDDIEKYAQTSVEQQVIRHVIESAPYETDRVKFEGFGHSNYRSREVGEALRALDLAKIVQLLYPTTATSPPISPDLRKRPRLQFLDTGMLANVLLWQGEMLALADLSDFHRGKIVEHLICQELISVHEYLPYKPLFWVREKKTSNAEVDIVYRHQSLIVPIEVKSGASGRLRSLHQFIELAGHPYAIRIYAGAFNVEKATTPNGTPYLLMNLPYYLGTKIPEYIAYFVENYAL